MGGSPLSRKTPVSQRQHDGEAKVPVEIVMMEFGARGHLSEYRDNDIVLRSRVQIEIKVRALLEHPRDKNQKPPASNVFDGL